MKLVSKIKKKFKKLNNSGSSLVMVVVALAFIGIIVGALLSAAMYGYRQKLQDLNSKNNFYNVEQAMQEIYAGVGINTIDEMQDAYTYTLTSMVYFNIDTGNYESLSDDSANYLFKKKFMENLSNSKYFDNEAALADALQSYITNDTVFLDKKKLSIIRMDVNGNIIPKGETDKLDKLIIKNVTLTRTQEYNNTAGAGTYTQTVSADIEVVKPEFKVNFNKIEGEYPAIFDYAFVGDSGIEISKFYDSDHYSNPDYASAANHVMSIKGDIYGASDYYNHKYNTGLPTGAGTLGLTVSASGLGNPADATEGNIKISKEVGTGEEAKMLWYNFVKVCSKAPKQNYANKYSGVTETYDGETQRSMFSGLYIDGTNVSIMTDQLVVPGCIAVMNQSDITVYSGKSTKAEVWTDDIVLGGESVVDTNGAHGAKAYFNADLYVRDDTEINSNHAEFAINGSYYGYGDSTKRDNRVFVSTVTPSNFTEDGKDTTTTLRDHYNSSAIIVNGTDATINLAKANTLYLAGRAYIQLSKTVTHKNDKTSGVSSDTYVFKPYNVNGTDTEFIRDYQTADSISIKNNQLMYEISDIGAPTKAELGGSEIDVIGFARLDEKAVRFFNTFFPDTVFEYKIPCVTQKVGTALVNYIDFDRAYLILTAAGASTYATVDAYKLAFVKAYGAAMNKDYDTLVGMLKLNEVLPSNAAGQVGTADALNYAEELKTELTNVMADVSNLANDGTGAITVSDSNDVYSSGAITTKNGSSVKFKTETKDTAVYNKLLSSKYATDTTTNLLELNTELERQYLLRKWTLNSQARVVDIEEELFIKSVVSNYGEAAVTPINYYMLMNNISDSESTTHFVTNGGHVWISGGDVVIDPKEYDIDEDFTGVIIAKGDVTLGYGIKSFKGTIIAGGKVYIDKTISLISAGAVECKAILDDCLANKDDADKLKFLSLFKMYHDIVEEYVAGTLGGGTVVDPVTPNYYDTVNIEAIDYSDVVSLANWQKTVGGGTDAP